MTYIHYYNSPLGQLLLAANNVGLIGLWLDGAKYFAAGLSKNQTEQKTPAIAEACRWLDTYFAGQIPDFTPPLHLCGSDFSMAVWNRLLEIPYGQTVTYGEISRGIAVARGLEHMSAQAVGGAVGHNPVSIIVPCHRVVGADGKLTGYAGGLARKSALLRAEASIAAGGAADFTLIITCAAAESRARC